MTDEEQQIIDGIFELAKNNPSIRGIVVQGTERLFDYHWAVKSVGMRDNKDPQWVRNVKAVKDAEAE